MEVHRILCDLHLLRNLFSGVWRGKRGNVPSPKHKNFCRNWYYLSDVYSFGEKAEILEKFSKNCLKINFPLRFLSKSQFFCIFRPNAQCFACRSLNFPVWWKLFVKCLLFWIVLQTRVDFLPKFQEISRHSQ